MKAYSYDNIEKKFNVDASQGLNNKEVSKRYIKYGENKLEEPKKKNIVIRFVSQFNDFMIIVLLIAAAVSFLANLAEGKNALLEPVIILGIVVMNAILGLIQEWRAQKSIENLKKLSAPSATVLRNKKIQTINASEVVPGDVIILKAGDIVCADARLIEADALEVDESGLTGESVPVQKQVKTLPEDTPLADRVNMVMSSCPIIGGRGRAVVVATGMDTEVGHIAGLITECEPPLTPLQKRLRFIGKILGVASLFICCIVFFIGVAKGIEPLEMFLCSVSLAVAAIPEGLPAIITIMLAVGVRKMAKKQAVMKNLPSVETLGSASVICSDKTGTLTENKMTVTDVISYDKENCLRYASLCCDTDTSNPTEQAILKAANVMGIETVELHKNHAYAEIIPFSSKRKRMSTLHKFSSQWRMVTKGATDYILPLCTHIQKNGEIVPLDSKSASDIRNQAELLGENALRVICVAKKVFTEKPKELSEKNLIYLGLIAMQDPPRPEAKQSVKTLKDAGVKTVMITGDHATTAFAIAEDIGICSEKSRILTGTALDKMSDEDLFNKIYDYDVYARVTPMHKLRIVRAWQNHGEVVAMTGDGVNDAPALSSADIGCCPGKSGTEVAKASADMIMTDDNFATIADAVFEGRVIFQNIKKAVRFLLSSNLGEIITVFGCLVAGGSTPLSAISLLWVNLITDSLPATALSVDPPDGSVKKNTSIFDKNMITSIFCEGMLIGALALFTNSLGNTLYCSEIGASMCFATLSISQLVHSFNMRSERSVFRAGLLKNKYLVLSFIIGLILQIIVCTVPSIANIFEVSALGISHWGIVLALSLVPLVVCEAQKLFDTIFNR